MTFDEYLTGKKIDSAAFRQRESVRWESYNLIFEQMHPESFTTQKKFIINDLRRQYRLKQSPLPTVIPTEKKAVQPIARPAMSAALSNKIVSPENEKPEVSEIENQNLAEPPKKPVRPVMKPVLQKPVSNAFTEPDKGPISEEKIVSAEEAKPTEPPTTEAISKKPSRPVMRPVIKRPDPEKQSES